MVEPSKERPQTGETQSESNAGRAEILFSHVGFFPKSHHFPMTSQALVNGRPGIIDRLDLHSLALSTQHGAVLTERGKHGFREPWLIAVIRFTEIGVIE